MPRGAKSEPSASGPEAPSKGDATGKAAKGAKAKPTSLAVSKITLKRKEGHKEGPKAAVSVAEGGLDIAELEKKRKEFSEQLRKCEVQILRLETQYFETANPQGNALKGYDGLLSSTAVSSKKAQFRPEDRIFSGSSTTGSSGAAGSG